MVICDDVEYVYLQPGKLNRIWCIHIDLSRFLVVLLIFFYIYIDFFTHFLQGSTPYCSRLPTAMRTRHARSMYTSLAFWQVCKSRLTHPATCRQTANFEAHPLPSPYGIIYTWNFGDNSSVQQGRERRRVPYTYAQRESTISAWMSTTPLAGQTPAWKL